MKRIFGTFLALTIGVVALGSLASASTSFVSTNGYVQVTPTELEWGDPGPPYSPYPGFGTFTASNGTGIFAGETAGDIFSLEMGVPPSAPFMTFTDGTELFLTSIEPGNTPVVGNCTTTGSYVGIYCYSSPGSAITLTDGTVGAQASLAVSGYLITTKGPSPEDFNGQFTATFTGTSVAALETAFATTGFDDTSYSGTFIANIVPEPSSALLGGLGGLLIIAGSIYRRRRA
jgi:hypothetical protein